MNFEILTGDNRETLKTLADNSVDAIVTDPPYGIDFLGKDWDANTGAVETYAECLRVLKPGGHILAFSAARTYHHLAVTLEQAGFEIRDQLMWLYGSGFPKAQDIGKAIDKRNIDNDYHGWKTALKPAHEPICMARKPFKGSCIDNVLTHGVGALNIDATRIEYDGEKPKAATFKNGISYRQHTDELYGKDAEHTTQRTQEYNNAGRFPSNVLGEVEGYQKYFYCPKVSRKERHCGFEQKDIPTNPDGMYTKNQDGSWTGESYQATAMKQKTKKHDPLGHIPAPFGDVKGAYVDGERMAAKHQELQKGYTQDGSLGRMKDAMHQPQLGNNHPTVKPVELMKYLIKLVTPENGVVLDPFNGSGSTGMAAVELGHTYIGCELDPAYVDIATRRITAWNTPESTGTTFEELFSVKED